MNPILFLDIDGVLLPGRMYMAPGQTEPLVTMFDPGVVGMLNTLGEECGAQFVIHSSWLRTSLQFLGQCDNGDDMTTYQHMLNQGLKAEYFHEDHSCRYKFSGTRWLAIAEWLDRHKEVGPLDYWILEDEPFVQDYGLTASKVITTNFDEGLTLADFYKIKSYEITSEPKLFEYKHGGCSG